MPPSIAEVVELLDEQYYSLGITSGHEALGNLIADFMDGSLDMILAEWGFSKALFPNIFFAFAQYMQTSGKIWKSHEEYHSFYQRKPR